MEKKLNTNTMFKVTYFETENKLDFIYQLDEPQRIRISVKDIDSKACIYSTESEFSKGTGIWTIPLPLSEINFKNDPMFGGFLLEYRKDGVLMGSQEIRIKEIPTVKKVADFSDTEPIFMNYCEFFEEKIYDRFDVQNLKVVFDIGASVGLWTNYILSQGAKNVYSFEPNRVALSHIRKNFENESRVTVIPNAVYYKRASIPFYVDPSNSLISSVLKETNNVPTYEVETVTLDEVMSSHGIQKVDLIKMDIEGAEFDIFENITNFTIDRVDSWLIEYHDFYFDDGRSKIDFLVEKLESFGYRVSKPDGYRFIFASKIKKNYWVDVEDSTQIRNLYDFSQNFSWENMNKGIQNGYHHAFNEMNFYYDDYTNGCIYERYGCKIEKGDVVVDVGANIGIFTNAAYHKGASRILSFEPGDLAFGLLELNKPEGCETFKLGISYAKGFSSFSLPSKNDTMSGAFSEGDSVKSQIYCLSIDDLFQSGLIDRIDFLKIDAEGSEWKILQGISDENLAKISKVSLELHTNYLPEGTSERIMNRMTNSGFKTFQLFIGDGTIIIYNFWR